MNCQHAYNQPTSTFSNTFSNAIFYIALAFVLYFIVSVSWTEFSTLTLDIGSITLEAKVDRLTYMVEILLEKLEDKNSEKKKMEDSKS
jgi:hypothetical protein